MSETIAFVGNLDAEEEAEFLAALAASLPEETIRAVPAVERGGARGGPDRHRGQSRPRRGGASAQPRLDPQPVGRVERLVRDLGANGVPIVRLVDPELARTMAEAVLAWTYYLQRDMPAYRRQQEAGTWRPLAYRPPPGRRWSGSSASGRWARGGGAPGRGGFLKSRPGAARPRPCRRGDGVFRAGGSGRPAGGERHRRLPAAADRGDARPSMPMPGGSPR